LLKIGYKIHENDFLSRYPQYNEHSASIELAEIIRNSGYSVDKRIEDIVRHSGFRILARYISNRIIGYVPQSVGITRHPGGRIIAYAAFGSAASSVRSGLINSDIRPDIFYDAAATPGIHIDGIPVILPDFSDLHSHDTILILLKSRQISKVVNESLQDSPAHANVWCYYDVLDYLVDYYY